MNGSRLKDRTQVRSLTFALAPHFAPISSLLGQKNNLGGFEA